MFASLQSNTAKALAESFQIPEHTDSVIFLENNQLWLYEEAAFRIANYCKAPLSFIAIANLLPSRFNRWVYTGIARNRKKWFGAYTTCPLPATRFRHRFITD